MGTGTLLAKMAGADKIGQWINGNSTVRSIGQYTDPALHSVAQRVADRVYGAGQAYNAEQARRKAAPQQGPYAGTTPSLSLAAAGYPVDAQGHAVAPGASGTPAASGSAQAARNMGAPAPGDSMAAGTAGMAPLGDEYVRMAAASQRAQAQVPTQQRRNPWVDALGGGGSGY